jgi:hypothetical protein
MAEHEAIKKHKEPEGIHRRNDPEDLAKEKQKDKDSRPEAEGMDAASLQSHASLLGDSRLSQAANAGQRASIVSDLQRAYGNAYVQRLLKSRAVQAKLTVNPPGDKYEQEADRVGDAVAKASAQVQRQEEEEEMIGMKRAEGQAGLEVQRQEEEEEEEMQMKRAEGEAGLELQRQEEEEEELQAKGVASRTPEVSGDLEERIKGAQGVGESVPDSVRASMEPHFGRDLGDVRVHADGEADAMSRQLGARAFTHGTDIFFREGDYQPHSDEGKRLLGHEMTHVLQQGGAPLAMQAAETKEEASTADKEDAEKGLLAARDKAVAEMSSCTHWER